MKILSFLFVLASMLPIASATEFNELTLPLPQIINQLSTRSSTIVPTPLITKQSTPKENTELSWASFEEIYTKGIAAFEYNKNRYALKVEFTRGTYDAYAKNYIAVPMITFFDTTLAKDSASKLCYKNYMGYLNQTEPHDNIFTDCAGNMLAPARFSPVLAGLSSPVLAG